MRYFGSVMRGKILSTVFLVGSALVSHPGTAHAQASFSPGWDLQPAASNLNFLSVKQVTIVETSAFATLTGGIEPDGMATISVLLDSVDTKIDLRNVRMRFLMFETFKFPNATIRLTLDPALLTDLPILRRKVVPVTYSLDLHGVQHTAQAEVAVSMISDDLVSVASTAPISVAVADYGLDEGLKKLEEAANVVIIPSADVSFELTFARRGTAGDAVPAQPVEPASAALETLGDFSLEACVGRFEILSHAGNIHFRPASAKLEAASFALLDQVVDIVKRCPDLRIEVSGHTDSDGSAAANQALSEARAASVAAYLTKAGIAAARFDVVGYGETRPIGNNAKLRGKGRNRRIEFAVVN